MVGDSVAVVGTGPIGLFAIILAKVMGSTQVTAIDISDYRLNLAKEVGADVVVNSKTTNPIEIVKDITKGLGVGIVIETSGNVKAMKQGFEILRKCGSYCMVGLPSEPLVLDAGSDIVWKGAQIHGIYGREIFATWEIEKNLLSSQRVNIEPIITHKFGFKKYKEAFDLCMAQKAGKVILMPD
jgi:threonine 3-dehydrogenase